MFLNNTQALLCIVFCGVLICCSDKIDNNKKTVRADGVPRQSNGNKQVAETNTVSVRRLYSNPVSIENALIKLTVSRFLCTEKYQLTQDNDKYVEIIEFNDGASAVATRTPDEFHKVFCKWVNLGVRCLRDSPPDIFSDSVWTSNPARMEVEYNGRMAKNKYSCVVHLAGSYEDLENLGMSNMEGRGFLGVYGKQYEYYLERRRVVCAARQTEQETTGTGGTQKRRDKSGKK